MAVDPTDDGVEPFGRFARVNPERHVDAAQHVGLRQVIPDGRGHNRAEGDAVQGDQHGAGITCVPFGGFHHAGTVAGPGAAAAVLVTLYLSLIHI